MQKRLPGSMRTRHELSDLIEGRLSLSDARGQLVELATRLIIEEALEAKTQDRLGRDYYEHGGDPDRGHRNGNRTGRLRTAEGAIEYTAPQVADGEEPFRSRIRSELKGNTERLETLAEELLARRLSSPCLRALEDVLQPPGKFVARPNGTGYSFPNGVCPPVGANGQSAVTSLSLPAGTHSESMRFSRRT